MASLVDIKVPDLGEFADVEIIEVMVKPGDTVSVDDPLVTIESDKATMEVPSPQAGVVKELKVKLGDRVSEGSLILMLDAAAAAPAPAANAPTPPPLHLVPAPASASPKRGDPPLSSPARTSAVSTVDAVPQPASTAVSERTSVGVSKPHASPSVRKFARELGADLIRVKGTGLKGRIFREDVQKFINAEMTRPKGSGTGLDLLAWPKIDFAKFGEIEIKPLSRIRKLSKANLARNWVMIPHVTQFDEADVTELEEFRKNLNEPNPGHGVKVTMLAFIMKALVAAMTEFPAFNSSLEGDNLVYKKYFHVGFAADTPDGLVVPVLHDVDKKGVLQIARETAELAATARDGKLRPADIQGGCITVSSLGGIGGTAFTPIINAPEVAILGVSKLAQKPVYRSGAFVPRLMLPLSLSYDHRVIDGATAARFITHLGAILADMRRALL